MGGLFLGIPTYLLFWQANGFFALFSARILQGAMFGMASITALSFISIRSPAERRGRNMGFYNTLSASGKSFGALAGGYLVGEFGFGAPYGAIVGLYGLSLLLVYKWVPAERREEREETGLDLQRLAGRANFQIQMFFEMTFALAKSTIIVFVPVYAYAVLGLSEFQLGIVVAARYLPMVLVQGFAGKLSDRVGRAPLVVTGGVIFLVSPFLLPTQSTLLGLSAISLLFGLGDSIRVPASWAVFADEGVDSGPATSFSFRMLAWRPGILIGPVLGGLIKDLTNIAHTFHFGGFFVFVALVIYLLMQVKKGKWD